MIKATRHRLLKGALAATCAMGFMSGEARAEQSHMHAALDLLVSARHQLQQASKDKAGHRVKAIAQIDAAIAEVKVGIGHGRSR